MVTMMINTKYKIGDRVTYVPSDTETFHKKQLNGTVVVVNVTGSIYPTYEIFIDDKLNDKDYVEQQITYGRFKESSLIPLVDTKEKRKKRVTKEKVVEKEVETKKPTVAKKPKFRIMKGGFRR